jgi:hypothetical protein
MRIAPIVTLITRSSNTLFRQSNRPFPSFYRRSMATETSVKSRQQPKWNVPVAKTVPVLKFQNSLTRNKVSYLYIIKVHDRLILC